VAEEADAFDSNPFLEGEDDDDEDDDLPSLEDESTENAEEAEV
jgi:hypothetical protein